MEPEFREIRNVELKKAGFKASTLALEVVMHNPNHFGVELSQTDLDILLDNSYFGHSGQSYKIRIPKKSDFIVPVILEVDSKKLLKNGLNALLNKKIEVRARGSIRLGKGGVFKNFKVDYAGLHEFPLNSLF